MRILIVDAEPNVRRTLRLTLETTGHEVRAAASVASAKRQVEQRPCDLALVDLRVGQNSGLDLLESLLECCPRLAVVVISAHASIDSAVESMRRGAFDYLLKPISPSQVRALLERVARMRSLRDRLADLEQRVRAEVPEAELDSPDPQVRRTLEHARRVAPSDATVLIRGESGTGKGVLARALHAWSERPDGPFITVSCPALAPNLIENELFGHVRGAFTGAIRDAPGKIAAAEGGTLFLDEVAALPLSLQPKLLRFLQERKYERVGESITYNSQVRIVAATQRDLEVEVATRTFRQDLLYRLNVIELTLPPLRYRTDIAVLADHLLAFFARQTGRRLIGFTPEAREALAHHWWPGNLRELRNTIERAAILSQGCEIGLAELPERIRQRRPVTSAPIEVGQHVTLRRLEEEHIRRVLASTASLDQASEVLRIDPSTLYRKRRKLGL